LGFMFNSPDYDAGHVNCMVYTKDESVFDAPLEKIWRYMQDETHQDSSLRFSKVLEQSDKHMVAEAETAAADGKTYKGTAKFTFNPRKGFDMEILSAPQAGTKHTHTSVL
jgi:hypothetical protein